MLKEAAKLTDIGLSPREANAYLALLMMEEAKAGDIARAAKEDRTNIYDSLQGLVKKGLASYMKKDGMTYYRAAPPERLRVVLEEKGRAFEDALPELNRIYRSYKPKPIIEIFEGKGAIKTVFKDILDEGKDFVGFGATDRAMQLVPEFTKHYLSERQKKKIKARQFFPEGHGTLPSALSEFVPVPAHYVTPATTLIYSDRVAIMLWFMEPPVVVRITNKEAAEAYRNQFEYMWKMAKGKRLK